MVHARHCTHVMLLHVVRRFSPGIRGGRKCTAGNGCENQQSGRRAEKVIFHITTLRS
ncbi:hypothetical protein BN136_4287 [Cronobacter universalis NCTC 9529]|nr:hypothetical protein BN136_4287 [Cronobacter universalis NCTC 9529]